MESFCTSSSHLAGDDSSACDELSMDGTIILSDCLEDLKSLRSQLYSAAEYFEVSYTNDDQKQIVANTLKDYAIQALVNTVDHLGSVTLKVNNIMDEKVDEVSDTELSVFCIEQRLRTCQDYIDYQGLAEQTLAIEAPRYQTHYVIPGNSSSGLDRSFVECQNKSQDEEGWNAPHIDIYSDVQPTIREAPPSSVENPCSSSSLPQTAIPCLKTETSLLSPTPSTLPYVRSGSTANMSTSPTSFRPEYQYPPLPRRSASIHVKPEYEGKKEEAAIPSKSKRLFNALLGRRKSKEDSSLYTYLDKY